MAPLVYFFGTFSNGFKSYPLDHTQQMFSNLVKTSRNASQIIFHREDNLVYYNYVREIIKGKFFGISVCFNCYIKDIRQLFKLFDDVYASMVKNGDILKINNYTIDWAITDFTREPVSITEYTKQISDKIDKLIDKHKKLPPIDFSISINECLEISLEDSSDNLTKAFDRYANVYITRTYAEIARVTSFFSQLKEKDKEIKDIRNILEKQIEENSSLKIKLRNIEIKQRNTVWLGVLGLVVVVFSVIIWNKVLFPSEVTHYETGDFVYYGPLKDGKPNGIGVAIYPSNDKDGRKYYIGNFSNGERNDSTAILFYQDGDYYYGSMKGDQWSKGMLYMNSDNSHFVGTFLYNTPYTGNWYDHKKLYRLKEGKKIY